eukprot:2933702-Pyramimonas_sp.AAC.1
MRQHDVVEHGRTGVCDGVREHDGERLQKDPRVHEPQVVAGHDARLHVQQEQSGGDVRGPVGGVPGRRGRIVQALERAHGDEVHGEDQRVFEQFGKRRVTVTDVHREEGEHVG